MKGRGKAENPRNCLCGGETSKLDVLHGLKFPMEGP